MTVDHEEVPDDGLDLVLFILIWIALFGACGMGTYAYKTYESRQADRDQVHSACVASAGVEACTRGARR